jgi:MFS family permease
MAIVATPPIPLGLLRNLPQFALLVLVNGLVGATIGIERSILSPMAEQEFHLTARTAVLSFIVVFGIVKALTNYFAGRWCDAVGRKRVLVVGWIIAVPAPFLLMWAPSWNWVLVANVFLGASQGLTWSTTVIMKIDLVGPERRGLAMGLNESAGYGAVALSALATAWVAATYGLRPEPFFLGVVFVITGLILSVVLVSETQGHMRQEAKAACDPSRAQALSPREVFMRASISDRELSSVSQAGLVNNMNDGMAWGLFPLVYGAAGLRLDQIGWLVALYPAVWGVGQLFTGALSDRWGRKWLIAGGMMLQAVSIGLVITANSVSGYAICAVLLGIGTAMVYPTLLAAVGDVAQPEWRASAVGVYRLWRDLGYAIGALLAGVTADLFGLDTALGFISIITFASGLLVGVRMRETRGLVAADPARPAGEPHSIEPSPLERTI